MLTKEDIEFIKGNRSQIMSNRTEYITAYFNVDNPEKDPYTGEIIGKPEPTEVKVHWSESSQATSSTGFARTLDDGLGVIQGDANVTFSHDVNVYKITKIKRKGIEYKVTKIDERGLGEPNRYECTVKRVE